MIIEVALSELTCQLILHQLIAQPDVLLLAYQILSHQCLWLNLTCLLVFLPNHGASTTHWIPFYPLWLVKTITIWWTHTESQMVMLVHGVQYIQYAAGHAQQHQCCSIHADLLQICIQGTDIYANTKTISNLQRCCSGKQHDSATTTSGTSQITLQPVVGVLLFCEADWTLHHCAAKSSDDQL